MTKKNEPFVTVLTGLTIYFTKEADPQIIPRILAVFDSHAGYLEDGVIRVPAPGGADGYRLSASFIGSLL